LAELRRCSLDIRGGCLVSVRFSAWPSARPSATMRAMLTITLHDDDLGAFRTILREQLAGDVEHLRDLHDGASARTPEVYGQAPTRERVELVERLAEEVGGLY